MIKKVMTIVTIVIVVGVTAFGISKKDNYIDFTANPNHWNELSVLQFQESRIEQYVEKMEQELPKSNIIIRATACGEGKVVYGKMQQTFKVEQIYKGENIAVGERIDVADTTEWTYYLKMVDGSSRQIGDFGYGCVNRVNDGEEYLLFLKEEIDTGNPFQKEAVYWLNRVGFLPVFSYEQRENVVIEGEERVAYQDVAQNEFFAQTQKAMELMEELKQKMIEKYPKQ